MSRQPAAPVVRPLPVVSTGKELRDFVLSRPANEDGTHTAYAVLPTYKIETSGGNVVPLVYLQIDGNAIGMYIEYCRTVGNDGYLVDATDVTTSVLVDDIPCAANTANYNDVTAYLSEVTTLMAEDGYEVDEVIGEDRVLGSKDRVDVLVRF